jgi:asparagine synthase (glutamine-hydrolysing)
MHNMQRREISMKNMGYVFQLADAPHFIGHWGTTAELAPQARSHLASLAATATPLTQIAISAARGFTDRHHADAWVEVATDRLILGRDAFGCVPLYWTQIDQVIWFASRLQVLLPLLPPSSRSVSLPALYGYSCFSYVPHPLTPVAGIFTIPAGTEQVWSAANPLAQPQSQRWQEWREAEELITNETQAIAELQTLLKAAIDRQISDLATEPVGVFLSGGLDSAVVAALLGQAGIAVRAYTLDFGDVENPEWPYAEQVAQHLNLPLIKVDAGARRIQPALIPTVQALDLPFGDGVTVPLYLLAQAASQDVPVIFNGEGGDQLFAGWTNKPLIAAGIYQAHQPPPANDWSNRPLDDFTQHYLRTFHRLWGYETQVFQPAIAAQMQQWHPADWLQEALDPAFTHSLLQRLRRATLMLKGAQNIHPRATALGWAHGLSVRSPFCDHALANWTFRLSGSLTLQGSCEKYILKRAVESWLPAEIVWRPKRGMGVPLTARCFNEWWHLLGSWLNPDRLRRENIWQPDLAAQIVSGQLGAHIQGRRIGETLWLLVMWEMWRSHIFGAPTGKFAWDHPFWLPRQLWSYRQQWKV